MEANPKIINMTKIVLFCLLLLVSGNCINSLLKPVWLDWNNYDTVCGFYEEPDNSIEVIFLGTSHTVNGFIPTELYEDYGICAYNLGTEQQPVIASYYWLLESYRKQSKTLKTVVFDVSSLRRKMDKDFYKKAIEYMQFSPVKVKAVEHISDSLADRMMALMPLFSYHTRWNELSEIDFNISKRPINSFVRGYNFNASMFVDFQDALSLAVPTYFIGSDGDTSDFNENSLYYFEKMVDFCNEQGIKLVLVKVPKISEWSPSEHNTAQKLADSHKLDFMDFNYSPYLDAIDYNHAIDCVDNGHLNYYGAHKLTKWMGEYLADVCGATDYRGNTKYTHMNEEVKKFKEYIVSIEYGNIEDICEYLTKVKENSNYSAFITVKDEAANALTQQQRERFANLGLEKLSQLGYRDSYLAIVEKGQIVYEETKPYEGEGQSVEKDRTLTYKYNYNGISTVLISGGMDSGNISSIEIDGIEYSPNNRGLNIVVYDNSSNRVVDSACFDTHDSPMRKKEYYGTVLNEYLAEGYSFEELDEDLQGLYLYNRKCDGSKKKGIADATVTDEDLFEYLNLWWGSNYTIFLTVKDEAAGTFNDTVRDKFRELGLVELSTLNYRDSYIGIIRDGQTFMEKMDHSEEPIVYQNIGYSLCSGGNDSGNISSVLIDQQEYSLQARGLNIVVYDELTECVVDSRSFDTHKIPVHISE